MVVVVIVVVAVVMMAVVVVDVVVVDVDVVGDSVLSRSDTEGKTWTPTRYDFVRQMIFYKPQNTDTNRESEAPTAILILLSGGGDDGCGE